MTARNSVDVLVTSRSVSIDGSRPNRRRRQLRDSVSRSGVRVLVVARAVAVVVESRDLFRAEPRGVPPDGVGAVLVPVLGVPDQVGLGHIEAFRFAFAGLDERRDRGVDVVVGVLGPSRHVLRLLRSFALSIARANRLIARTWRRVPGVGRGCPPEALSDPDA